MATIFKKDSSKSGGSQPFKSAYPQIKHSGKIVPPIPPPPVKEIFSYLNYTVFITTLNIFFIEIFELTLAAFSHFKLQQQHIKQNIKQEVML